MKLLVFTQKVSKTDQNLGFFHRWIEELAKHCRLVTVICLERGEFNLPENVRVFSLGKEGGRSRLKYLFRFYRLLWRERANYEAVFVHMNPEYVLLGGLWWWLAGRRVVLWYTHKSVTWKLRLAERMVKTIFTASPESCRLVSKKVQAVGHGIEVEAYPRFFRPRIAALSLVSIGRISSAKNLDIILDTVQRLKQGGLVFTTTLAGGPITAEDVGYAERIKKRAVELGVRYLGPLPHDEVKRVLSRASIFLSASTTGSVDKAVLEAAAVGVVPIFSGEAFVSALGLPTLRVNNTPESFAERIRSLAANPIKMRQCAERVRRAVLEKHDLIKLVVKIIDALRA